MESVPASGVPIAVIAQQIDVPAQRVLEAAWLFPDVVALTVESVLKPDDAVRVRAARVAAERRRRSVNRRPASRTPSGQIIPKPGPPTSDYAQLLALQARATEDRGLDGVRRALGIDRSSRPRRRAPRAPLSQTARQLIAKELRRRWEWYSNAEADRVAQRWVEALVIGRFHEPMDVFAWWDAGYTPQRLDEVVALHRAGLRGQLMGVRVRGDTVKQMLNRGEPAHYVARLLRDDGRIE